MCEKYTNKPTAPKRRKQQGTNSVNIHSKTSNSLFNILKHEFFYFKNSTYSTAGMVLFDLLLAYQSVRLSSRCWKFG